MTLHTIIEKLDKIEKRMIQGDKWLNTRAVCRYTGLSVNTIRRGVDSGKLKRSTVTGKNLYFKSDVDRWLRSK